jgi:nucleotide-binding universal stress UspA family protein
MHSFAKLLFPVDFTEASHQIVPYVRRIAEPFESQIHILFVARIMDYFSSVHVKSESIQRVENELLAGARRRLQEFIEQHFADRPGLVSHIASGDAGEEILRYVEAHGIELVFLGTHGRKGLDRIVFGSVANFVSRACPVPVFLVNPQ